jgi:hypothetical protein
MELTEITRESVRLGDMIYGKLNALMKETCTEDLEQIYAQFCALKDFLETPELDAFIQKRPPKVAAEPPALSNLDEKGLCAYVRRYAETKGSTQGMAERLVVLFPPPKGKRTYVSDLRRHNE